MAPAVPAASTVDVSENWSSAEEELALLQPFQLGPFQLAHRIVMAPLSRVRSYGSVPQPHAILYYSQRATQGGLIITEGTLVSEGGRGMTPDSPGIWTQEHVEAWKPIVKAVHDKEGIFFNQLAHTGRASHNSYQPNGAKPVSSTSRALTGDVYAIDGTGMQRFSEPHALEIDEIPGIINEFVVAAKNARAAGFDGVELHGGFGFLLDQFMKSGINDRTDKYGGSLENRARFVLELVDAVVDAIGADRVGIRLTPFSFDLNEATDSDPAALGLYMAQELSKRKILYVQYVEARSDPNSDQETHHDDSLWAFRKAFTGGAFFAAGGYTREKGNEAVKDGKVDGVIYGRLFLANPDLVRRFELDAPLNKYNRDTFYSPDPVVGYTDYPYLEESHPEFLKSQSLGKLK